MAVGVGQYGIGAGVVTEQSHEDKDEQDPADRVTRLPACDDHTHAGEDQFQQVRPDIENRQATQGYGDGGQYER